MSFREQIQRQASNARRKMVRSGALLPEDEFLALLGVDERRLASLVAAGSVFSVEVEDVRYFPAILGDPKRDRARLHSVCRILVPAPSACRLGYLESRQADLGDISPLDALADEKLYRSLRRSARAWAAGWCRTVVKVYVGSHLDEPDDGEPVHTAVDEVDPRTALWKRVVGALQAGGYVAPAGPYPQGQEATVFVSQVPAGDRPAVQEARIAVRVARHLAHVEIFASGSPRGELSVPLVGTEKNIVDIVLRCVEGIRLASARVGQGRRIGVAKG